MESPWNVSHGLVLHIDGQPKRLDHSGFPQVEFTGQYPIGQISLNDPASSISAVIESYSPFIPLDYDNSSLPVTVMEITLKNASETAAKVELEAYLENAAGRYQPTANADDLRRMARPMPLKGGAMVMGEVSAAPGSPTLTPKLDRLRDWGSMALAIITDSAQAQASRGQDTAQAEAPLSQAQEMAVRAPFVIPAKGEIKTTVLIAWHFPQLHPDLKKLPDPQRWVAGRFTDAGAVATYVADRLAHLSGLTHAFRDTWYGTETGENRGTLPHWLLERALWTISTLTTNVTYRLTQGRIWGWEGTGCCPGTCTHVWHYAQGSGRLFPQLEIDLRERTDFTPEVSRAVIAKGRAAYAGYFNAKDGYFKAKCTEEEMLPIHVGPGSHIDMCLGDFWLAQVGLLSIGNKQQLREAMDSLYKYNFVPDMGVFREKTKPHSGRHYALAGEGGLVMATWPHGGLPEQCKKAWQFMYFQECMSGFEHSAAALMVSLAKDESDPLLTQGLTVCRAVHDRYDASRRNPYNEIECSDHYARAMASYGVFIAACGFYCHAGQGLLRFEPKIGAKDFAGPFIGAGAWGHFSQKDAATGLTATLAVRFGSTRLARLELTPPVEKAAVSSVTLAGKPLDHRVEIRDGRLVILLAQSVSLTLGKTLEVNV